MLGHDRIDQDGRTCRHAAKRPLNYLCPPGGVYCMTAEQIMQDGPLTLYEI